MAIVGGLIFTFTGLTSYQQTSNIRFGVLTVCYIFKCLGIWVLLGMAKAPGIRYSAFRVCWFESFRRTHVVCCGSNILFCSSALLFVVVFTE
jgi:hypothetical protein